MKKVLVVLLLIALGVGGAVLLKKRKEEVSSAPLAVPITYTVRTVKPGPRTVSQASTFLARLESRDSAGISSKLSGRILDLPVSESQEVRKGTVLVRIDEREILASIESLKAQLASSRKQEAYNRALYGRDMALFKAGGLAREKLEASEVALSQARSRTKDLVQKIEGLRVQLDYLKLRAPFHGIVGTVFLRPGDLATPGRPILTLNSLPQKLTFSFVPGKDGVVAGQDVLLDGVKRGKIVTVYNDARNGLSVAEAELDGRLDLPDDSYLAIEVVTKAGTGCAVPVEALLHRERGVSVMVLQGDGFKETPVTVKAQDRAYALIEPAVTLPVAVGAEAKLSLLPTCGRIRVLPGERDE